MNGQADITIDPQAPTTPGTPTGPTTVTAGNSSDYTTTGATYADTYTWEVTPTGAGTFSGTGLTGTIAWNTSYSGTANIKVVGVNTCGNGEYSTDVPITVLPSTTGIQDHGSQHIVTLYPNPANDFINLVPVKNVKVTIKMINSVGAVVIRQENVDLNGIYRINVEKLTPGVYFINIISDDEQQIQKVVIN
jgi:hypothetical protein